MNRLVSIIIPIYNTESGLLKKSIESAIAQSYSPIEIIVIDDGSDSRDTISLLEKYEQSGKIKLLKQKNSGVSVARNLGLEQSNGEYVLFLDSDDYIEQNYIKKLTEIATQKNADLVFSGKIKSNTGINDSPFQHRLIRPKEDFDCIIIKAHAFTSQGVLIKGELARSVRFTTTTTTGEDTEYIVKAMVNATVFYDGSGGYHYVKNDKSITHELSLKSIERYLNETKLLCDSFDKLLSPDKNTIYIFKLLKLSRATRKMAILRLDFRRSKSIINSYISKNQIKAIPPSKILKNHHLTFGEKVKILLLNYRRLSTLLAAQRIMTCIKGEKR